MSEGTKRMNPAGTSMEDLSYQYYVAESVVEQFALSHTPTAILRELVQNEYDAGGQELSASTFGSERMVITGNGYPIDDSRMGAAPGDAGYWMDSQFGHLHRA